MEEIIRGLYVGSDKDVAVAKQRGYSILSMAKDGPDGHRAMLGYTTLGAPKGKDYLWKREGDKLAVNILDLEDPTMIPDACIDEGMKFIKEMQDKHRILLVHCNAGHSRSATTVLMYLRAIGELPDSFLRSEHMFRTIYPPYSPGTGMRAHARTRWKELPEFFGGKKG